jgi:nucleoside-diphosphate-sugar epimerase
MTHLITGGSGFLGNLIARRLHARGERVRILDVWEDPSRPLEIEFVKCDIRDVNGVAAAMRGVDVVHHNVALVPLTKAGAEFWSVNVDGSRIAAERAVKVGVKTFIHMSSSAIFGAPEKCPVTNDSPIHPVEIYGRAKLAGELAVRAIAEKGQMPLIVIRPRTILGEGRLGIFQILFQWISENRKIYVIGNGNQKFQFVHAHDLMDAYLLAMDAGKPGVYNVGTDRFGTLRESLEHVISHARSTSRVASLPAGITINTLRVLYWLRLRPLAPWHYLTYHKAFHFDVQPLLDLGWKPRYSNDEMFRERWDWFVQNKDRLAAEAATSPHRSVVKQRLLGLLKRLS